jgi:F-type H+-transporting ATPase subunit epsilon
MADKKFFVDIVSPSKEIFSGEVLSLTAPGTLGGFQVLYNHADLLTSLAVGEIKIVNGEGNTEYYATSGGFLEVKKNKVIILTETIEKSNEIETERAKEKISKSKKLLEEKPKDINSDLLRESILKAKNRIKVAEKHFK